MPFRKPTGDSKAPLTGVGCVLTLLTFAVIVCVAISIVRWRDPETGEPLPTDLAIWAPLLIGASFHGISSVVLRLVGLRVWSKPEKEGTDAEP